MTKNHPDVPCERIREQLSNCPRGQECLNRELPLSKACCRGKVRVCRLGGDRKTCARMASLGLLPGRELELVCPHRHGGQCLIRLDGGTLSLDADSARAIYVTEA